MQVLTKEERSCPAVAKAMADSFRWCFQCFFYSNVLFLNGTGLPAEALAKAGANYQTCSGMVK
jgi:hypothetical protein